MADKKIGGLAIVCPAALTACGGGDGGTSSPLPTGTSVPLPGPAPAQRRAASRWLAMLQAQSPYQRCFLRR